MIKKLVFASNNTHKLSEIISLAENRFSILSLADIGCFDEIAETSMTLEGNAFLKAHHVFSKYGMDCFADDTGLEIDALNGRPGVFSARYAGEGCSFNDNIVKLLDEMKEVKCRTARFRTTICLIINGIEHYFEGRVEGEILSECQGKEGFGYDPVFRPTGYEESFAEMPLFLKNQISHRGRAVEKLMKFLIESAV
ncbi:MAG: non-canonical purine NTP diphosphatase [Bacteroidales bacterium]|jgi:XTP/dITP diphosphohydrolase|nr:non-canonical purine NTP diphosphatase [Bacteroidales bacterium]